MNITDINAGDRIKCTITAGLKAEVVDGVVFFAGKLEFNAARLDYGRTLSVRSATDPRKVWAFTTLDARGAAAVAEAERDVSVATRALEDAYKRDGADDDDDLVKLSWERVREAGETLRIRRAQNS